MNQKRVTPLLCNVSLCLFCALTTNLRTTAQTTMDLQLRTRNDSDAEQITEQSWKASETAIIVCDVWDYHHCFNAVGRIGEFAPRLDQVLIEARKRGAIIIHSPSDCMDAYTNHPARQRAINATESDNAPADIDSWCSSIPAEEMARYPIDQSDGGEDDDPVEHAKWAQELEKLGRNPSSPWKRQSDLLTIEPSVDYISDRGDEVWNILESREIKNVILVGVHTNMCVLGRPFGLRQMVLGGKNVVLMRDMTDAMYNPNRWPYVSHFEGTRRIVFHIERHVCPTISSDQIIGGKEFRFQGDDGRVSSPEAEMNPRRDWTVVSVPEQDDVSAKGNRWYRCVVRMPESWFDEIPVLETQGDESFQAWINGVQLELKPRDSNRFVAKILRENVNVDDANLVVVRTGSQRLRHAPIVRSGSQDQSLSGNWQMRVGDSPDFRNMPLPAKFGAGSDTVFKLKSHANP